MNEKSTTREVTERMCHRLEAYLAEAVGSAFGSWSGGIQTRKRALSVMRERHMPLIRVEPRINSSLREEFVRFYFVGGHYGND